MESVRITKHNPNYLVMKDYENRILSIQRYNKYYKEAFSLSISKESKIRFLRKIADNNRLMTFLFCALKEMEDYKKYEANLELRKKAIKSIGGL